MHNFAILFQVAVTAGIVKLERDLLLVHTLGTLVHVQHSRLVVVCEGVVQEIGDETCLADRCVANEDDLELWNFTIN